MINTERRNRRIVNTHLRHRKFYYQNSHPAVPQEAVYNEETAYPEAVMVDTQYLYAGFWMRVWAFLLDLIAVFSLKQLLVYPLLLIAGISYWGIEYILTGIVFFLYFAIMTKKYGQTIGKMVFGLKVVSANENDLSWNQIIFREGIGRLIHQIFFFLQLIYITVAFTTKKQGLHDLIADTFVIHERNT